MSTVGWGRSGAGTPALALVTAEWVNMKAWDDSAICVQVRWQGPLAPCPACPWVCNLAGSSCMSLPSVAQRARDPPLPVGHRSSLPGGSG